ncbi:MAG: hypothetical protein QOH79_2458, partial [Acidimicrobiaceae bacterium]
RARARRPARAGGGGRPGGGNLPPTASIHLSPGDLDEAVATFLAFGAKAAEAAAGTPERGTAFERLDAFRSGFFEAFNNGLVSGIRKCTG